MPAASRPAVLLLACVLLAGCGDGTRAGAGAGSGASGDAEQAPTDGGAGPAGAAVAAATPQEAALAFYGHVGQAQFGAACRLIAPATQQAFLNAGKDCATEIADDADAETRAELQADLRTVTIDESKVEIAGDTAEIANDAWVVPGKDEYEHSFDSVALVRLGGAWYLVAD